MRSLEFQNAVPVPANITDSRFGLRNFFLNDNEKPSIGGVYAIPGKGPNGESQN